MANVSTEDLWDAIDALDALPETHNTEWYKRLVEAADAATQALMIEKGFDKEAVDMMWLFKGVFKWFVLALIWIASVIFATTSALLMDAISDGLSNVFGITTPYAQEKNNNLNQKTAIKKTRAKSQRLAAKMVTRNVMDAGSVFIPVGGAVIGVGLAAADVYAACELIDIQN